MGGDNTAKKPLVRSSVGKGTTIGDGDSDSYHSSSFFSFGKDSRFSRSQYSYSRSGYAYSRSGGAGRSSRGGVRIADALRAGPRAERKEHAVNLLFFRRLCHMVWLGWDWYCLPLVMIMMVIGYLVSKGQNDYLTPLGSEVTTSTLSYLGVHAALEKGLSPLLPPCMGIVGVTPVLGVDMCDEVHAVTQKNIWTGGTKRGFCMECQSGPVSVPCYAPTDMIGSLNCTRYATQEKLIKGQPWAAIPIVGMQFLWCVVLPLAMSLALQIGSVLCARIRRNLTRYMHSVALRRRHLYSLVTGPSDIDNYDQRIAEDMDYTLVNSFAIWYMIWYTGCVTYLGLKASINGMWAESHRYTWEYLGAGTVLSLVSWLFYLLPMNMASRVLFNQKAYEANYRWVHSRTIEEAESICLYGGEAQLGQKANERFADVVRNFVRLSLFQSCLTGSMMFFTGFPPAIANVFVYLAGITDVLNIQGYVNNGLGYLTGIPKTISGIAKGAGPCHRVGSMLETLHALDAEERLRAAGGGARLRSVAVDCGGAPDVDCDHVEFASVTAGAPGHAAPFFEEMSFSVRDGEQLCIVGDSGSGKTAVLRVLAGLWTPADGRVLRPRAIGRGGIFFLPQRPYVTAGSLRAQVTYPHAYADDEGRDALILSLLAEVDLGHLAAQFGLDAPVPWADTLSGGEMQRLNVARLLYHRPRFAVLDEATSALNADLEDRILALLQSKGMGIVRTSGRQPRKGGGRVLRIGLTAPPHWSLGHCSDGAGAAVEEEEEESAAGGDEGGDPAELAAPDQPAGWRVFFRAAKGLRYFWGLTFYSWTCPASQWLYLTIALQFIGALSIIIGAHVGGAVTQDLIDYNGGKGATSKPVGHPFWSGIVYQFFSPLITFTLVTGQAWIGMRLSMYMREAVTEELHRRYFRARVPYVINVADKKVTADTIDQRMQQDQMYLVDNLQALVFGGMAGSDFRLGSFIGVMQIATCLIYGCVRYSWFACVAMVVYIVVFIPLNFLVAMPMGRAMFLLARAEGFFRAAHARLREFAESVRFHSGEDREAEQVDTLMESVYQRQLKAAAAGFGPMSAGYVQGFLNQTMISASLSFAAIVLMYNKPVGDEYISALTFYGTVAAAPLGWYTAGFGTSGVCSGLILRVNQLLDALDGAHDYAKDCAHSATDDKGCVEAAGLGLAVPGGTRQLFSDLSFRVAEGDSLLIQGPSGAGKSSLLRTIAGIWRPQGETVRGRDGRRWERRQYLAAGNSEKQWRAAPKTPAGTLRRPTTGGANEFFFLPQRSYLPEGTLRQQVLYPALDADEVGDEEVTAVLKQVGLRGTVDAFALDEEHDWMNYFSGGEKQRLGFARLLLHRPKFAALDEATSLLDERSEEKIMRLCADANITLISVAHRDTMRRWHHQSLTLDGCGGHRVARLALAAAPGEGASALRRQRHGSPIRPP